MRSRSLLFSVVLCLPALVSAQTAPLSGYITAVQPSGAFDLEGIHIRVTPATEWRTGASDSSATTPATAPATFYLGETLDASGRLDAATHTLTASRIVLIPPALATVSGTAIIDLVPPPPAGQPASDRTVRADGFLLRITENTKLNFAAPLTSVADIATNQWIDYSGVQQLDGTVLVTYAGVGPNTVSTAETKLRAKNEYDPAAVTQANRQGSFSAMFRGTDARRVPPYPDDAMQARVQRIAESLIPAYQRALPDTDPTRIHFRFQVIDATDSRDAYTLPSGIVAVPYQVIHRLQNDDQLAAVLASSIADALEKEGLRSLTATRIKSAGPVAKTTSIVLLSTAGLAGTLAAEHYASRAIDKTLRQSGRVSLDLLHDAGYDITQAPLAWWLLSPKSPKPLEETPLPPRAADLYLALGTTWHPVAEATPASSIPARQAQ